MSRPGPSRAQRIERRAAERARRDGPPVMPIPDTIKELKVTADHPHTDPGDGRTECDVCGKWVFEVIHSCKRVPVTEAAWARWHARQDARGAS